MTYLSQKQTHYASGSIDESVVVNDLADDGEIFQVHYLKRSGERTFPHKFRDTIYSLIKSS